MVALAVIKVHTGDELIPMCADGFNELWMATAVDVAFAVLFFSVSSWVNG